MARRHGRLGRLTGKGVSRGAERDAARRAKRGAARGAAAGAAVLLTVTLTQVPAAAEPGNRPAAPGTPTAPPVSTPTPGPFDPAKLRATLDATHEAGMFGLFSATRDGRTTWDGASGTADVRTERPVTPNMRHRVGSITKTFVATAILQQVEKGRIALDAPVSRYLPGLIPGALGDQITVRMLLNHTSGIGEYVGAAFPSFGRLSPQSLDRGRFRTLSPEQLVEWGLQAPPTGIPGERWSYSNTNYIIAGLLLEEVTGTTAERYIARNVIAKAGLKSTYFPSSPWIFGPHSRMYESLYQQVQPPRDYSVYNMSWAWTAGGLISTTGDLNRFYRGLLTGKLIGDKALVEMKRTVAVRDADGNAVMHYGLGLYALGMPCGTFWGHDGAVFGAGTQSLSTANGQRQTSIALNLTKYQQLDATGMPVPHPVDNALGAHVVEALCGSQPTTRSTGPERPVHLLPLQSHNATP